MMLRLSACVVRNWQDADAPSLARYANNFKIWLNLRDIFPHPYTLNDAITFIRKTRESDPPVIFAIATDSEAIGSIGIRLGVDVERISAEIGYWIGEPFWGKGIATEALRAVTNYAIEEYGLSRVFAVPFAQNPASFRVLEKAGFVLEGRMHKSSVKNGVIVDQLLYALTV